MNKVLMHLVFATAAVIGGPGFAQADAAPCTFDEKAQEEGLRYLERYFPDYDRNEKVHAVFSEQEAATGAVKESCVRNPQTGETKQIRLTSIHSAATWEKPHHPWKTEIVWSGLRKYIQLRLPAGPAHR